MHRSAAALPALALRLATVAVMAGACSSRAVVTRRAATPAERTAVVECAAAIVTDEGFTVTERRTDLGLLSASSAGGELAESAPATAARVGGGTVAVALAGAPVDLLTVAIAKHPLTEGLALRVRASSQAGDSVLTTSSRAAVARDRIIRSCAYLVG